MKERIRSRALELGFDDCRFTSAAPPSSAPHLAHWLAEGHQGEMAYLQRNAAKRADPQLVLAGARSVIVLSVGYGPGPASPRHEPSPDGASGVIARYARHPDYHDVVGDRLQRLSQFVDACGGAGTRSLGYVDTGPLLERDLAQRAGLGFAGKHTNLISRTRGNWILLAEILTTAELAPDAAEKNRCGSCVRCLDACPTRAITAPFVLDARKCISYLTIELKGSIPVALRRALGRRIFGCDDCLAVCPWNRFAREGRLMGALARADLAAPDLVELLSLNEADFKKRFDGTPMQRSRRRGLLRNVAVALGNVGDRSALAPLARAKSDPEPLIAEHATWAMEEIEQREKDGPQAPGECL